MEYYFGVTFDGNYRISHRFYLYDNNINMMYCGDNIIKDIAFNSSFYYFKQINKNYFPISKNKFDKFLLLSWPNLENSCFLTFVEHHAIEEWVM